MNKSFTLELKAEKDTQNLAARIAAVVQPGDVITLKGDLGAGKTTFARAFIQAWMQEACEVPSPTFTLVQTYQRAGLTLYHFDLYRLKSASEVLELGLEEALYDGITLIEWPERLEGMALSNHLALDIRQLKGADQGREVHIAADSHGSHLLKSSIQ